MTSLNKQYNPSLFSKGKPSVYGKYYKINLLQMVPKWNLQPKVLEQTTQKSDSSDHNAENDEQAPFEFKQIETYEVDRMNQQVQVNQYMISKLLGKGAQGMVRMASDTKRLYAIKIINCQKLRKKYFVKANELRQMISVQSRLMSKLNHPNVIKFYQALYSEQYQKLCIVLQYCSKGSLQSFAAAENPPQNWNQKIKQIVKQSANGLFYLHSNNIAHRDVKSQNILISEKQVIKYCDFNISSKVQKQQQTNLGFQGTKLYAPPELLIMTNNLVSPYATDIWALGMTILEVAARKHPFADKSLQQLQLALKQQVPIADGIDNSLKDLLNKMLNLDWRKRPTIKQVLNHPYLK